MNTRRKQALMSWVMALMILFSTFSPMSTAIALEPITTAEITEEAGDEGIGAVASGSIKSAGESSASQREESEDPTVPKSQTKKTSWLDNLFGASLFSSGSVSSGTVPRPGDMTVLLRDKVTFQIYQTIDANLVEITEDMKIDSKKPLLVRFSIQVPVEGDFEDEADPNQIIMLGDTAEFALTNAFTLTSGFSFMMKKDDKDVGTVNFVKAHDSNALSIQINFDGSPEVFSPTGTTIYHNVIGRFDAELLYDATDDSGEVGDHVITILGKQFTVTVPPKVMGYTTTKTGKQMPDQTIEWEVTVAVTEDGVNADLKGKTFFDDLALVGDYVPGSFSVNGLTLTDADLDSKKLTAHQLSYEFQGGTMSPKTVKFRTRISDEKYFATEMQTISNTAALKEGETTLKTGTHPVSFTPQWITKTGKAQDGGSGDYDPTNRKITWTIEANQMGAALIGVVITDTLPTDLTFESAKWFTRDTVNNTWVEQTTLTPIGVANNEYHIPGPVNTPIKLEIVSKVKDDAYTADTKTFYNTASIGWSGLTKPHPSATSPGVGIGYSAISKTGVVDLAHQSVRWTVDVNMRGQTIPNAKVYDLLVYGDSFNETIPITWLDGVDSVDSAIVTHLNTILASLSPKIYQKYAGNLTKSTELNHKVYTIMQGGVAVADLLEVTDFSTATNSFSFDSTVLNPNLFAGNRDQKVHNTASLFSGTKKIKDANAEPSYNSHVLAKEMLRRVSDPNDLAGVSAKVNDRTKTAAQGFHYIDKSVIYRLVVNADGLDLTEAVIDTTGAKLGTVTVQDQLPPNWGFAPIEGRDYLIFEGVKQSNNTVLAKDTTPDEPIGLSASFVDRVATFIFTKLDRPYIILIKAKPSDAELAGYFDQADNSTNVRNTLSLTTANWTPNPSVSDNQDVTVAGQLLTKSRKLLEEGGVPKNGVLRWTLEYKLYDLAHTGTQIADTLPIGLDLRIDKNGNLLRDGNITINEMTLGADGSYTLGTPVSQSYLTYNSASRELIFDIPDSAASYRITYITDITGDFNSVLINNVRLIDGTSLPVSQKASYTVTELDVQASMELNGFLKITKTDKDSNPLAGAEFTLYAMDGTTVIRHSVSNADGIAWMKILPDGDYLLRETKAPSGGYKLDATTHTVSITTVGSTVETKVDGKVGANAHLITVKNYTPTELTHLGSLKISKTVTGEGTIPTDRFTFNLRIRTNDAHTYIYTIFRKDALGNDALVASGEFKGNGVSDVVVSPFTLAHGEWLVIDGLPVDATYTVEETDALHQAYVPEVSTDGGIAVKASGANGTIIANATRSVDFSNSMPGSLKISKAVDGTGGSHTKEFEFTVNFADLPTGTPSTYPYGIYDASDTLISAVGTTIASGGKIRLKHGDYALVTGLPAGTKYTVAEASYLADGGYTTDSQDNQGTIASGEESHAAFTNHAPGSLKISKTIVGDTKDATQPFRFTVDFTEIPDGDNRAYPYGIYDASDTLISGATITSGGTIDLKHGEYALITALPSGTGYTVSEDDYLSTQGYITDSQNEDGTIASGTESHAAFTNYAPGSLKISKTVEGTGGSYTKEFEFTVSFTDLPTGAAASFPYTITRVGVPAENGILTSGDKIRLKHNEHAVISRLPMGTKYQVSEAEYIEDGYVSSSDNANAQIAAGAQSHAEFTYTKPLPGTLTIQKQIEGFGASGSQRFDFTVDFRNALPTAFRYEGTGVADGMISSGDTISLSHGQCITIYDLTPGAEYEVTEADYLAQGFVAEQTTKSGGIVTDAPSFALFTNYKPGSLEIGKIVDGNAGDLQKPFDFTVDFSNLPVGAPNDYPYTVVDENAALITVGRLTNGGIITLKHGEKALIEGLPKDTAYHVTEADYRRDGYITAETGADGVIAAGELHQAEFTNTRNWYPSDDQSTGTLTIKKTVTGRHADQDQTFTFMVEFEGTYDSSFYYSGSRSGHIKSGQKITLAHGEQVEISGIPVGTAFQITEVEANQNGYYSTSTGASGKMGELGRTAAFVNSKSGIPNTGDDDSTGILAKAGLVFFTAVLGALIGLEFFLRRKESGNEA